MPRRKLRQHFKNTRNILFQEKRLDFLHLIMNATEKDIDLNSLEVNLVLKKRIRTYYFIFDKTF